MSFQDITIKDFLNKLASSDPIPGGGGAAALASGLACALSSMVFNLTVGKKQYNAMEEKEKLEVDEALQYCERNLREFIDYIDKDAEAFMNLMNSYKLPKENEEQLQIRNEKINSGSQQSMQVPFELAIKTLKIMDFILVAAEKGNTNVISDAGVAVLMADAAIESCLLNVKINLNFIKYGMDKEEIEQKCKEIQQKSNEMKKLIMDKVLSKIG